VRQVKKEVRLGDVGDDDDVVVVGGGDDGAFADGCVY
jgi:hypothetical protein